MQNPLFESVQIGPLSLKNRIVMAPMTRTFSPADVRLARTTQNVNQPLAFFFELVQRDGYQGLGAPNAFVRAAAQQQADALANPSADTHGDPLS